MSATGLNFHDQTGFKTILETLLKNVTQGSFGRLHMVMVRSEDRDIDWPRLMPKVRAIAEDVLRHRLSPDDACLEMDPGRYLLLFPRLSEIEGHIRATAISRAIKARLVGEDRAALDVVSNVLPLDSLRQQPAIAADPVRTMDTALDHSPQGDRIALDVHYQPVWSSENEAIIGNRTRIHRIFGGQELYEAATMLAGENDPFAAQVNDTLTKSGAAIPPGHGTLFLPVAINAHTLQDYDHLLDNLRKATRRSGSPVVVELAGAIGNTPRQQVRRLVDDIRHMGAKVGARVMPERESARFFRDCGVEYLCLNESQAKRAGFTHSAVYALFTVVGREVDGMGFRLCLWNASTPEDVKRASALGFEFFSGAPIGATALHPIRPRGLITGKIYA